MTSHRLLIHLGAFGLIIGACAAETAGGGSGGTASAGGSAGSRTAGGMSTGGVAGTGGRIGTGGATTTGGTLGSGGGDGTGGISGTGGATTTGGTVGSGGQSGTGGVGDAGVPTDAMGSAGAGSGGRMGGGGQGGSNMGGTGMGGSGSRGSGGATGGWPYPAKNQPVPSAGCGQPAKITSSVYPAYRTIMSGRDARQYVINLPVPYDMNKPYRFIYASHGQGGEGNDIQREKYYGLQNIADAASSVIFVSASGLGGIWGAKDVPLFDDILDFVKKNACVDESRVFVLGFSFGGMYSYSLSMTRQKSIRAAIGMSPANFNIDIPTKSHDPIAWMQSTGVNDRMCPWVFNEAQMRGSKFIAIEHGTDNGCMVPNPIPTWTSGGMLCNDFAGCKADFPTRVCTFNGAHGLPPGSATWMWSFITQF